MYMDIYFFLSPTSDCVLTFLSLFKKKKSPARDINIKTPPKKHQLVNIFHANNGHVILSLHDVRGV